MTNSIIKLLDYFKNTLSSKNWNNLLRNPLIKWTPELLDRYSPYMGNVSICGALTLDWFYLMTKTNFISDNIDKINWGILSYNAGVPWTRKDPITGRYILIDLYENNICWKSLTKNPGLMLDSEFVDMYFDLLDIDIKNNIKWTKKLIKKHSICICDIFQSPYTDWNDISFNYDIPVAVKTIYHRLICESRYLPWKQILLKTDFLNNIALFTPSFKTLMINPAINWSEKNTVTGRYDLIEEYKDKINWSYLTTNTGLKLTVDFIETYRKYLHIDDVVMTPSFVWTEEHIKIYSTQLGDCELSISGFPNFNADVDDDDYYYEKELYAESLINNKSTIWTEELINKYIKIIIFYTYSPLNISVSIDAIIRIHKLLNNYRNYHGKNIHRIFGVFGEKNIIPLIKRDAFETMLISTIRGDDNSIGNFTKNRIFDRNLFQLIIQYLV